MRGTPARRAPDRCNVSHGTLHLHDGCEAARLRPGSQRNQHPWETRSTPHSPLRTWIWSQQAQGRLSGPSPCPPATELAVDPYRVFPAWQ